MDRARGGPFCTKGYGHLETPNPRPCDQAHIAAYIAQFPGGMNQQQAEQLLVQDIAAHEVFVNRFVHVELTQEQYDALVSFTFNAGPGRLQQLRQVINNENCDPNDILQAFQQFGGAGGVVNNRRIAEANLFNNGIYF
jgi:lysozyme